MPSPESLDSKLFPRRKGTAGVFLRSRVGILAVSAAMVLVLGLLRYAIDLLVLIAISAVGGLLIRRVNDALGDRQSGSTWPLMAVATSLGGVTTFSLWLLGADPATIGLRLGVVLPEPVVHAMAAAHAAGWGQRLILRSDPTPREIRPREPGPTAAAPARFGPLLSGSDPAPPIPRALLPSVPSAQRVAPARHYGTSAEAATARPGGRVRPESGRGAVRGGYLAGTPVPRESARPDPVSAAVTPAAAPASRPPESTRAETTTILTASPHRAVVGTSVRLVATVSRAPQGEEPRGDVVFRVGGRVLGRARLFAAPQSRSEARLTVLDLALGTHRLTAEYLGDGSCYPSRSADVEQIVSRR